jgi:RND superfamily putative drug exporter
VGGTPDRESVGPIVPQSCRPASWDGFCAPPPQSEQTYDLVKRLRRSVLPQATAGTQATTYVGGFTATQVDFTQQLSALAVGVALPALAFAGGLNELPIVATLAVGMRA